MASNDSESDWDRQNSNHGDNSPRILDDDNQKEKELEDKLKGISPYRFEPYTSGEEDDSKEEPTTTTPATTSTGCKTLNGTVLSCSSHKQVKTGLKFTFLELINCR